VWGDGDGGDFEGVSGEGEGWGLRAFASRGGAMQVEGREERV
jgi:hypothetical protein